MKPQISSPKYETPDIKPQIDICTPQTCSPHKHIHAYITKINPKILAENYTKNTNKP